MGGCLSTPSKSSRRRRRSRSCAPVKYEYYYTVRNGETLLVRRRVGDSRRQQNDDSSSPDMNVRSGHRRRRHDSSSRRRHKKTRQSGSGSHHQSRTARSARDEEWEAEQRRNQVAFWAGESTRGHDRASSQGVGGQGSQNGLSPDEHVSSLHEDGHGDIDVGPPPSNASKRSKRNQHHHIGMEANAVTRYKRARQDAEVIQSSFFSLPCERGETLVLFKATSRRTRNRPKTHKAWLPKRGWPDPILFASFHGFW
ncbi:hypothetical protein HDV63DRAFT_398351 [Trichoderma sp. SZMC 28014]